MQEAGIHMPVTLLCPSLRCRAVLQVPDTVRGKAVRCGHCGTVFSVPLTKQVVSRVEASRPSAEPEEKTV